MRFPKRGQHVHTYSHHTQYFASLIVGTSRPFKTFSYPVTSRRGDEY